MGGAPADGTDRRWAALLAVFALGLYATTLCRTVYFYDSAELASAAALLGIPHPPGYPLYTLLGHLYVTLIPGEPAFGANVMSAVHGALCVGLVFLIGRRLGASRPAAATAAALFSVGPSFWWNSSVAEVYTTGLVFVLGAWLLLLQAVELGDAKRVRWAALVAGLGFAAHMSIATLGLGYVWLAWCATRAGNRVCVMLQAALATLAGASLYLYLPLRSSMHPALDYAHVSRLDRFAWMLSGGQYKYWFLRDFAFVERASLVATRIAQQLGWPGTCAALVGVALLCVRKRELGIGVVLAVLGNVWFFFGYRVHDVEVFFLPSIALLAPCAAVAATCLSQWTWLRRVPEVGAAALAALTIWRAITGYSAADLSHDDSAFRYGRRLEEILPPNSVMIDASMPEEWKYKAVFEHYFQKVRGSRPDVTCVSIGTPQELAQVFASGRPVFAYTMTDALAPRLVAQPFPPLLRVAPAPAAAP